MSEPFTETCQYCGSPEVLDDAWWCDECWDAYYEEYEAIAAYQERTPLTRDKALSDLYHTKASVWGPTSLTIEDAANQIARLAKRPVGA